MFDQLLVLLDRREGCYVIPQRRYSRVAVDAQHRRSTMLAWPFQPDAAAGPAGPAALVPLEAAAVFASAAAVQIGTPITSNKIKPKQQEHNSHSRHCHSVHNTFVQM